MILLKWHTADVYCLCGHHKDAHKGKCAAVKLDGKRCGCTGFVALTKRKR